MTNDNPEGKFQYIDKNLLRVDAKYQRDAIISKCKEINKEWSWIACGVITVVNREGRHFVIDGQHRAIAATYNDDITDLPCMVFESPGIVLEAKGFLLANSCRKNMSSIDKFKAKIICGDKDAIFVDSTFNDLGVKISRQARGRMQLKCVGWALRAAKEDRISFCLAMNVVVSLCRNSFIPEALADGIFYLLTKSVVDDRMVERFNKIGRDQLLEATRKAAIYRSAKRKETWAEGILNEVNKGLRNKYELN